MSSMTPEQARRVHLDPVVTIGWCDEHSRYFYWRLGCGQGLPVPTSDEIQGYYRQGRPVAVHGGER